MEGQIEQVVREKILTFFESPPPELTRRETPVPPVEGKAFAVIGMRRAGKTSFLHQCRADLIGRGRMPESLLYFNFEDERLGDLDASRLGIVPETLERLFPRQGKEKITLFLDEIQLVDGWETFVRRMLDTPGHEVFVSGSSAKLLSQEIATSMRGRGWEIVIHPFSFSEFLAHRNIAVPDHPARLAQAKESAMDRAFADYLTEGGFPEAQGLGPVHRRLLLQNYVDVLLLRDVIERHSVANPTALRWLLRRLLSAPASLFSISRFASDLKSQGIAASKDTLHEYLAHLEDAFLLATVPVATDSEKRRQVNPRKIYPADPALIPVFDRSQKANTGHVLETVVFNHLQRAGADIRYVKTGNGFEVDFHARYPDGREELIQVSASVDSPETLNREVRALQDARDTFPGNKLKILTAESRTPFPSVPEEIQILPAWKWALNLRRDD